MEQGAAPFFFVAKLSTRSVELARLGLRTVSGATSDALLCSGPVGARRSIRAPGNRLTMCEAWASTQHREHPVAFRACSSALRGGRGRCFLFFFASSAD